MKIAILDDYLDTIRRLPAFSKLSGHDVTIWNDHTGNMDVLAERLRDTEALVTIRERSPIRASLIKRLPHLRLISCRGDYLHIDIDECTARRILVCADQHPDIPNYATAELAWGLIIAALRRIPQQMAALRAGHWQTEVGQGLRGRTLGIYGYGKIGKVLAEYGRVFGMKVVVWGRPSTLVQATADGYQAANDKASFFEECDVITLQIKLREETRGIVTAEDLGRMKPSALLVNTSRAGLIAPNVLENALTKGRPGMAALDVFEAEPLTDTSHPLLNMDNVICTPHIGYVELSSYDNSFGSIFDQVNAFSAGKPINMINPAAVN